MMGRDACDYEANQKNQNTSSSLQQLTNAQFYMLRNPNPTLGVETSLLPLVTY